jgi:hypothetical protein
LRASRRQRCHHGLGGVVEAPTHLCGERGAKAERPRLHSDECQPLRQQAKRSGQLDGLGDAEPMRPERRRITAQRRTAEMPHVHPAGVAARVDGVHDDHVVVSAELLDERDRLVEHDHRHPREAELRDAGRHLGSDRVVAAGTIPDADHEGSHARHSSSTVRRRKWVAHEMHGS